MPWYICIGPGGPFRKKICFHIPVLIRKFEIEPDPDPWIKSDLLKPRLVKDLQILATIDTLAEGLSSNLRGKVHETVRGLIDAKQELPPEVELNFGRQ
jgi:hypothetical protein